MNGYRILALVCLLWGGTLAMTSAAPPPLMIADFEDPEVLQRIVVTKSASVSLSEQDAVSGRHCLEVRVGKFSQHGDQWPYVFLIDKYFPTPLDLSHYSRVVASVRNVTEGLATVMFYLSSKPYNDGGRNLEGEGFVIPGGSTMQCALPTSLFRRPMNDPSTVQALMFVFPPNETEAIYRIDSIQAVYDPAVGSPAEKLSAELQAGARGLQQQIATLDQRVNWAAVPAERAADLRQKLPALAADVQALQVRAATAAQEGWQGTFNASRDAAGALSRRLGEYVVADKTAFHLWQRPRYFYPRREVMPTFTSPVVERLELAMAGNEYRDLTWMVTPAHQEVQLQVRVTAREPGLAEAVQLRWSEYVTPPGWPEYGDVLEPLRGTLTIPPGESRELWATFDTRWHDVKPGRHELRLQLTDRASGTRRTIPITLTVWPFALPSYDVLPNNAYVEFHNSEIGTHVPDQGTRHMKRYGVNTVYVLPVELPWPVEVDAQGKLTGFDPARLTKHINQMLKAWREAPGDERLTWIFSLSGAPTRLLKDSSVAFMSDPWNQAFAQWLKEFRTLVQGLGIAGEDWMYVLADEASTSVLASYEVPFAELIKRLDPQAKITCNASQVITDPVLAERYFRVFDTLQPCLDVLKHSAPLREFVGVNQRPLWTYRCENMAGLDRNLYDYYRVYTWDNLNYGIVGTGIWTYCAQGDGAWVKNSRSLSYNLVFKARDRDELIHSRRYEFYREGADDFRYVQALQAAAQKRGARAEREAEALIKAATADILSHRGDVTRAETWRLRLAEQIMKLQR
jgi:hypothetical protein